MVISMGIVTTLFLRDYIDYKGNTYREVDKHFFFSMISKMETYCSFLSCSKDCLMDFLTSSNSSTSNFSFSVPFRLSSLL
jgi:hypothetical protein